MSKDKTALNAILADKKSLERLTERVETSTATLTQPTVFTAAPRSKAHERCGEIEDELTGLDGALEALETRLEAVLIAPDSDKDASPFVSTTLDERHVRIRDRVRFLTDVVLGLCERADA